MKSWNITPRKKNNKDAKKLKRERKMIVKIKAETDCNGESASKDINFDSEEQRKRMAQNFYR